MTAHLRTRSGGTYTAAKVRPLLSALLAAVLLTAAAGCGAVSPDGLPASPQPESAPRPPMPIHALTPGAVIPGATVEQVCTPGYSRRVRHVLFEQHQVVFASYGIAYPQPPGTYELDHLIPLELGGDNSNVNLWPEPALPLPGFHQKDELENILHGLVCSGRLDLADAQAGIAADWVLMYHHYLRP